MWHKEQVCSRTHLAESIETFGVTLLDCEVAAAGVAPVAVEDKCDMVGDWASGEDGEKGSLGFGEGVVADRGDGG